MIKGYLKGQWEQITLKKYSNIGSENFYLIGYRDPCLFLQNSLQIYRNQDQTEKLIRHTDFRVTGVDNFYSSTEYEGESVASTLLLLNPEYYTGDLYITYKWIADYASAEMFNRFDRGLEQMTDSILTTMDAGVVVDNNGNLVVQGEAYPGYREEL